MSARLMLLLFLLLGWPPAPLLSQEPARREALQERVFERFLELATDRLELDGPTRERLAALLREGQGRREELRRELLELRRELARGVADPRTSDADIRRALDRLAELREREFALWREEQDALARVLSPRRHAEFLGLQVRFAERVRDLRRGRRPPPRQGGPPGEGLPRP